MSTSIHAAASDDMTPSAPSAAAPAKNAKRRHPAAAGRILSVGLSSSAFLSMIAAFGSQTSGASAASSLKTPLTRPRRAPKIVIKDVHHTIYVDQCGRPIAAPSVPKGLTALPGATQPAAGSGPKQSGGGAPYGGSTSGGSKSGARRRGRRRLPVDRRPRRAAVADRRAGRAARRTPRPRLLRRNRRRVRRRQHRT